MNQVRYTGRVKWFNKKSGYGFLTVCDDNCYKDKDIFAHFSEIQCGDEQYKYLVQGEYVEFAVVESKGGNHEFQAALISGIMGGITMCDTHRENPRSAPSHQSQSRTPVNNRSGSNDVDRPARVSNSSAR